MPSISEMLKAITLLTMLLRSAWGTANRIPAFRIASLVFGLMGCKPRIQGPLGLESEAIQGPPQHGGYLHIATYTDVRSLDSAVAFDTVASAIEQLLYSKLLEFNPNGQGVVPDLAEHWQQSEDGKHYSFQLRQGVLFHDGTEVKAEDIKRSLERALHPDTPCPVSSFYERIAGVSDYTKGKSAHIDGIKIEGEYSLSIELSEPDATLLFVLALPTAAPVCRSAGSRYDRDFSRHPCGAGPFKLKAWDPGRRIQLERFEGYYQVGLPYLDGIEWSLLVPHFAQRIKFERGELDTIRELNETDSALYQTDPRWKGHGQWETAKSVFGIFMNTETEPFRNPELRRAVATGINRGELAALHPGHVKPASRLLPAALPGFDPSPGQRFDYTQALEHMRKAGFPYEPSTGRGGYPRELSFVTLSDSFGQEAAEIYQQQLARIGIRFHIRLLSWPALLAETGHRGVSTFGYDGWSADFPDPSDFFEPLFSSRSISDEDSSNRSFYSNPAFDYLLDEARHETNQEARLSLYRKAESILEEDAPWAIASSSQAWELWQPYLHGYRIHPFLPQHLGFSWIDATARNRALTSHGTLPFTRDRVAFFFVN